MQTERITIRTMMDAQTEKSRGSRKKKALEEL